MPDAEPADLSNLMTALVGATLRLADEHSHIIDTLTARGLIDDHTHAMLTARLDQLDAATTALQRHHAALAPTRRSLPVVPDRA
jgi:hypothetical protein